MIMKIYSVLFKDSGKTYNFKSEDNFSKNDYVIVDTENGLQYGKIYEQIKESKTDDLKKIIRLATTEDTNIFFENMKDAEQARKKCIDLVKKYKLNMNVLSAKFSFDRTQLLFDFTADDRVDFRELAKKLASIYHTRIELHQIGARDKAKKIGGVGVCGQKLCCQRFLDKMEGISMNMAKVQNLALNPSKINGSCGRLMCCLAYEEEAYEENNKNLPQIGQVVKTTKGEGQVISVNVLEKKYKVLINGDKEEFKVENN